MKALFNGSINEFKIFTDTELKLYKWIIYDMNIHDRYEKVKIYSYIDKLEESAFNNNINHEETEVISWLDSQMILLKVIKRIEKENINILNDMYIIQEYHIPFTNKRADYLLIKNNRIMIIEFSYAKLDKKEYQYQNKLNQVINYKELISNVLPLLIDISTYTFILHPEEDDININQEQINNFIKYVYYYFKDKTNIAYEALLSVDV